MLSNDQALPGNEWVAPPSHALARHLARGVIGFGLIGAAFVLTTRIGPVSLLLLAPGMVALRGCPTCWIVGLIATLSAGGLKRTCADAKCTLSRHQHRPFE